MDEAADVFAFGRTAEVFDGATGKAQTWTLVGPTEANLAEGKLSAESPMGRSLVGSAPGATVEVETPRGTRRYRIDKVLP